MRRFARPYRRVMTSVALVTLILGLALSLQMPKSTAKTLAVDNSKEVQIRVKVTGNVGLTADEFEDLITEKIEKAGFKVVEDSDDDDALELYFGLLANDGDMDDDGSPDAKDADDNGDGIDDSQEKFVSVGEIDDDDAKGAHFNSSRRPLLMPASFTPEPRFQMGGGISLTALLMREKHAMDSATALLDKYQQSNRVLVNAWIVKAFQSHLLHSMR